MNSPRRAAVRRATEPFAVAARYDRRRNRIIVSLSTGLELAFPPHIAEGLEKAKPEDLTDFEISRSGFGTPRQRQTRRPTAQNRGKMR